MILPSGSVDMDTNTTSGPEWILASSEAALRWAELFLGRSAPSDSVITVSPDQVTIGRQGQWLFVAGLVLVAVVIYSKS